MLLDLAEAAEADEGEGAGVDRAKDDAERVRRAGAGSAKRSQDKVGKGKGLKGLVAAVAAAQKPAEGANAGQTTREACAQALLNIAEYQWSRGPMIQAGVLKALARLAGPSNTTDGRIAAAQAMARTLITTNPAYVPHAQVMDAIGPLLWVARQDNHFAQFEAAMAITNIASVSDSTKRRVVREKGVSTLNYLMFSDNLNVRRAGTEALTNLIHVPEVTKMVLGERLKLWLAFAQDWDVDVGCSSAASGAIAMLADDPENVPRLVEAGAVRAMLTVIWSGEEHLQHRAVAALRSIAEVALGAAEIEKPVDVNAEDDGDGGGEGGGGGDGDGRGGTAGGDEAKGEEAAAAGGAAATATVTATAEIDAESEAEAESSTVTPAEVLLVLSQGHTISEGGSISKDKPRPEGHPIRELAREALECVIRHATGGGDDGDGGAAPAATS